MHEYEVFTLRGADAIPELIRASGTEVVFGMLGGSNTAWVGQGWKAGAFRLVRTRHEETALNAAVAYGRVTKRVGICTTTRGPGFANTVNALISATLSHSPVLLIVGESPTTIKRTSQIVAQREFTELIGAGFHHIGSPIDLANTFHAALREAARDACPQVLSIGDGVLEAEIELQPRVPDNAGRLHTVRPDPLAAERVVDLLAVAEQPLILAGQGAVLSDCRGELETLAELTGADLATTLRANSMFTGHSADLGLCGSWSSPVVHERVAKSDLILSFGASLDGHTTHDNSLFSGATIVFNEVNPEKSFKSSSPDYALLGDAGEVASEIVEAWRRRGLSARTQPEDTPSPEDRRTALLRADLRHDPSRGLDLRRVYEELDRKLPSDRVVVTDLGRFLEPLPTLLNAQDAQSWILGRGYGSIGLGVGMAIGAAAAVDGERSVALFCGDGGFMMAAQDLDAVRLNELSLTIFILNDEQYGSDIRFLAPGGPEEVLQQTLPDISLLAASFGGVGTVVRTERDLRTLDLRKSGLHLVDIRIDPVVNAVGYWG